jgi:hypothetical protein
LIGISWRLLFAVLRAPSLRRREYTETCTIG